MDPEDLTVGGQATCNLTDQSKASGAFLSLKAKGNLNCHEMERQPNRQTRPSEGHASTNG